MAMMMMMMMVVVVVVVMMTMTMIMREKIPAEFNFQDREMYMRYEPGFTGCI